MIKYPKIPVPFKRDTEGTKRLIDGDYIDETIRFLANDVWDWTEKIDGTNISVEWDGHSVHIYGRTEKSEIPKYLQEKLDEMFLGEVNEQMFEQLFGAVPMVLYGEGYGAKIQDRGNKYRSDVSFILFDVYQPKADLWLRRESVESIAKTLGCEVVPIVAIGTIADAIALVKTKPKSTIGTADMEGVVGRPQVELKGRTGNRIITKVKVVDFT